MCLSMPSRLTEEVITMIPAYVWKALTFSWVWWLLFFSLDEFRSFVKRLPQDHLLNMSAIFQLWNKDIHLQRLYKQLEGNLQQVYSKTQSMIQKLFSMSKRCDKQPQYRLPRERWVKRTAFQYCCRQYYCLQPNIHNTHYHERRICDVCM